MRKNIIGKGLVLICGLQLIAAWALAEDKDFSKRKQKHLRNLDRRISSLQNARTCLSSAADQSAAAQCHKTMKEERMKNRKERMNERPGLSEDKEQ